MRFSSVEGEQRYDALVRVASRTVVGLDFDGTLSPIVDDPAQAHIHPDAPAVLAALAEEVAAIAVITGRPARQALDLGGLEEVGDALAAVGKELFVFGQYGNERWSSSHRRIRGTRPPRGLATFERDLPRALRSAGATDAYVEDKGLAVAVHTRRLPDPEGAFDRLLPPLRELADRHGLVLEPGRSVIEVRSAGSHKGMVVHRLAEVLGAEGFLFAGDDLGDVEAFEAVEELARDGLATLRVCSASDEQSALVALSDVVVHGPVGVLDLLGRLAEDARAARTAS
ncbi:trehalose-phosphatase [Nocardioides daeguensis]|uniref:Trehalose 6-phosphate phosphatase n=1 Tax=Nocardioides daeguensis TaxID=908359 RepID=A0ABP6W4B0_9ACTN|nr:trehalose-phosphatase [Nocardioides daeguensis]MBV6727817.1 trehalose-phosphatase [Nocardioides daeguensis]MCR1775288.1 trehalose-phosphatase [Nocardioides daeguensis]